MMTGLTLSVALVAATPAQPEQNDLSALPLDQQSIARCMFSAVKANPRVSNARVEVRMTPSTGNDIATTREVLVEYDYAQILPELKRQARTTTFNITPFLAPGKDGTIPVIVFEGITPKPEPPGYFRDSHNGIIEINAVWEKNCWDRFRTTGK